MISIRIILIRFYCSGSLKRKDIFSACSPATVRKSCGKVTYLSAAFAFQYFLPLRTSDFPT